MSVKQEALNTLNTLSESVTWDEVMYTLYVKQKISEGLKDINDGKTVSHEDAVKRLIPHAY